LSKSFPKESCFLMLVLQKSQDRQILQDLVNGCRELKLKAYLVDPDWFETPSQWLSLMGRLDMLIGMRLHALLMALKSGKAVVGLPYDPKVDYLLDTFKQPKLSPDETTWQALESSWTATLKDAFQNRLNLASNAQSITTTMEQRSCKNHEILARILAS
jgi:polysaccharide pyruvyl transferase WcaK-like protein